MAAAARTTAPAPTAGTRATIMVTIAKKIGVGNPRDQVADESDDGLDAGGGDGRDDHRHRDPAEIGEELACPAPAQRHHVFEPVHELRPVHEEEEEGDQHHHHLDHDRPGGGQEPPDGGGGAPALLPRHLLQALLVRELAEPLLRQRAQRPRQVVDDPLHALAAQRVAHVGRAVRHLLGQDHADAGQGDHHHQQHRRRREAGGDLAAAPQARGEPLVPGAERAGEDGGHEQRGRERLDDERQQHDRDDGQDEERPARRLGAADRAHLIRRRPASRPSAPAWSSFGDPVLSFRLMWVLAAA